MNRSSRGDTVPELTPAEGLKRTRRMSKFHANLRCACARHELAREIMARWIGVPIGREGLTARVEDTLIAVEMEGGRPQFYFDRRVWPTLPADFVTIKIETRDEP
jgi:hypothetical protein